MRMNQTDFVSASKEVAIDLALLLSSYQKIKMDNASTHSEIEFLDGQFGEILSRINEVIEFADQAQQAADMVSDSLKSGLELTSRIMREKTRILQAKVDQLNIDVQVSLN